MDTTSINELPSANQQSNNITLSQNEISQQIPQQMPQQMSQQMPQQMPQQDMQSYQPIPLEPTQTHVNDNAANINSVLERARETGSLSLPSRDIPMDTTRITHDNEALPDYIPNKNSNYIEELVDIEELQDKRRRERNKDDSIEEVYKELQLPIFIGILFFLFNLPITNKYFHQYFTIGFNESGSLNLQGYLVKSFLFASIYYILNMLMVKLSNI